VAFSPSGNGSGSRGRGRFQGSGMLSEINVTPFVDVLLVLLIIFMLTAHVMESGIEVDVPAVKTTKETTKDLPIVTVTKEGLFYLGESTININELAPAIVKRYGKGQTVYIRGDKQTQWDTLAQVVAELGAAKISISLVTKPEDTTRKRR
jgi:biopolymer transport protein ExbD